MQRDASLLSFSEARRVWRMLLVAGVRGSFRGKDAGSLDIRHYRVD